MHHIHAAFAGDRRNTVREFVHDGILPGAELLQFDLRLTESNPASGGMFGFVENFGSVEERFGRDTAAIEANPAEPFLFLDQNDFFAFVGGVECGSISARTCSKHNNVSFQGFHDREISSSGVATGSSSGFQELFAKVFEAVN